MVGGSAPRVRGSALGKLDVHRMAVLAVVRACVHLVCVSVIWCLHVVNGLRGGHGPPSRWVLMTTPRARLLPLSFTTHTHRTGMYGPWKVKGWG